MSTQEWSLDWIKMDEKPETAMTPSVALSGLLRLFLHDLTERIREFRQRATEAEHSFDENSLVG